MDEGRPTTLFPGVSSLRCAPYPESSHKKPLKGRVWYECSSTLIEDCQFSAGLDNKGQNLGQQLLKDSKVWKPF